MLLTLRINGTSLAYFKILGEIYTRYNSYFVITMTVLKTAGLKNNKQPKQPIWKPKGK